jgi:hypothetical protein
MYKKEMLAWQKILTQREQASFSDISGCAIPHTLIRHSNRCSRSFPLICAAHLYYIFGLVENYIEKPGNAKIKMGPYLQAKSPLSNRVVFKKHDVIIPSAEKATEIAKLLTKGVQSKVKLSNTLLEFARSQNDAPHALLTLIKYSFVPELNNFYVWPNLSRIEAANAYKRLKSSYTLLESHPTDPLFNNVQHHFRPADAFNRANIKYNAKEGIVATEDICEEEYLYLANSQIKSSAGHIADHIEQPQAKKTEEEVMDVLEETVAKVAFAEPL